jgi:glutamine amidotransferase
MKGMRNALINFSQSGRPVLGICLGMQLLGQYSEEAPQANCLGILDYISTPISNLTKNYRCPHVGWNQVAHNEQDEIFKDIPNQTDFYFSHSFAIKASKYMISKTFHGDNFISGVKFGNIYGVQFHPERSQAFGERLLSNFCNII